MFESPVQKNNDNPGRFFTKIVKERDFMTARKFQLHGIYLITQISFTNIAGLHNISNICDNGSNRNKNDQFECQLQKKKKMQDPLD